MSSEIKTHYTNDSLYTNAGMSFPECYAGAELLDLDKGRLPTSGYIDQVTCKNCLRIVAKHHWNPKTKVAAATRLRQLRGEHGNAA